MEYSVINLKEDLPTVELALANLEIHLELMKKAGGKVVKVIHGYGSHGVGGAICNAVRKYLFQEKRKRNIKDVILGDEWDISSSKTQSVLKMCPDASTDEDLNHRNTGITVIVL